jgi:4-amino-4-deoxychorismate lyase
MILVNGTLSTTISVLDRGFQYGMGLFETMAWKAGVLEYVDEHLSRMAQGCQRLSLPFPRADIMQDLHQVCRGDDAVIKLIVTGGDGRLRREPDAPVNRVVMRLPWPEHAQRWQTDGVRITLCHTRLSCNQATRGVKLLNWLEPALAASELDGVDEGLMQDEKGNIIEGTISNVFFSDGTTILTPDLGHCGLPGIVRSKLIERFQTLGTPIIETTIHEKDLPRFDQGWITNSIIGICPIRSIDGKDCSNNLNSSHNQIQFPLI